MAGRPGRHTRLEDGDRVGETIDYPDAECADFSSIVVDADLADELEGIGYSFDGMSFSGLRAVAGVIWYP